MLVTTSIQICLNLEWAKPFMMLDFCAAKLAQKNAECDPLY